jgi:RNA polymerase sigma-70 factor (ECF subfamily)
VTDRASAAALDDLHARGAAAWTEVELDRAAFATELARRLGVAAEPATIASLHHDVYLAIACAAGDPVASVACERLCELELAVATQRLRATPTQADDLRSELRRLMFTGDDARLAGIAGYTGRGDLRGYIRVIAARALAKHMRRERREMGLDDELLDAFGAAVDPDVAFLRDHYRADVDAVVRAAIPELPDRSRAVLRYHLLDGWSIDQIGALYGVHRATAARWLTNAREELGTRIRAGLAERLAIGESQVDSIVALVTSRIELSLERLLGDD